MRSLALISIVLSIVISASRECYALLLRRDFLVSHSHSSAKVTVTVKDRPHHSSRRSNSNRSSMAMAAAIIESESELVLTGSKLTYFGIPGRGEAIRLALAIGGIEFEDRRVPFPAWGKIKPTTPWGTLPVLELTDGTQLAQSRSILRFVGKNTGLYPDDQLVAQRVDELMDVLEDLSATITNVGQGLPKNELEAVRLAAVSEGGAVYDLLARIDSFIEANGISGYAVGSEMNIASILTFTNIGRLVGGVFYGVPRTVCDPFPNIQLVRKTVGTNPDVAKWYDTRVSKQKSLSPAEQVLVGCRDM